jgi:hypothetical protein
MPVMNQETGLGFHVGDVVSFADRVNRLPVRGTVVRVMPVEHTTRTYHIRIESEKFERSVEETDLTEVGHAYTENVFGL